MLCVRFFSHQNAPIIPIWPSRKRQHLEYRNPLVKRWRRSRISRSRPHEHINLGLPFKRESRDLKQLTFVKAAATITHEVAWIDNGVHRPSHRIWHSPVTSKTGVWVLVSQSTIVALQLCPQMNSLWQCFFLT